MASDASAVESSRQARLAVYDAQEKAEMEAEDAKRRRAGKDNKSSFVREQEKVLYGSMGLEDRLKRGRAGLVREDL